MSVFSRASRIGFLSVIAFGFLLTQADARSLQQLAAQRKADRLGTVASTVQSPSDSRLSDLASEETERVQAVEKAEPAVASVIISKDLPVLQQYYETVRLGNGFSIRVPRVRQQGSESQVVGGGTAFFVSSDGLLMTNKHVVEDPEASYTVLLNDGQELKATVAKVDSQNDIALLKVERANTPALSLADDADVHLAQTAIAIGNALGEYRNTVSVGVVSGLGRSITAASTSGGGEETLREIIQTDAAINRGNSGGPLLNIHGQVIGMNTAVAASGQNIGFAIPVGELRRVIDEYNR